MIVVADAGPLRYLILIRQIHVLGTLFQHVLLPNSVVQELSRERTPLAVKEYMANLPDWIEVSSLSIRETPGLEHLDKGESDAITLAVQSAVSLLLVDDAEARAAAQSFGLGVLGTVGILERAAALGLLDFTRAFEDLDQTNFHMSDSFRQLIRERHRLIP